MEIKIDYKELYEAAREQRMKLADSEAALIAAVKTLTAQNEALRDALLKSEQGNEKKGDLEARIINFDKKE